jgi:dTDP-4-dehydrorhamnose 3,5-epimerase
MKFTPLILKGAFVIDHEIRKDERGAFTRTFCKKEFSDAGITCDFVQFNHSWNSLKGTLRGMHYQLPPFRENKLIRCIRGSVHDVIIDLREGSPTFLQHAAIELSEQNSRSLFIPEGFAHGFLTLENNSQLIYHHTEYYKPSFETGLRYDDPILEINWPGPVSVISDRDKNHSLLNNTFKGI